MLSGLVRAASFGRHKSKKGAGTDKENSSHQSVPAPSGAPAALPALEGYLLKKHHRRAASVRRWGRRYVVMDDARGELRYYPSQADSARPTGGESFSLPLSQIEGVRAELEVHDGPNCLSVTATRGRSLTLKAPSALSRDDWVAGLSLRIARIARPTDEGGADARQAAAEAPARAGLAPRPAETAQRCAAEAGAEARAPAYSTPAAADPRASLRLSELSDDGSDADCAHEASRSPAAAAPHALLGHAGGASVRGHSLGGLLPPRAKADSQRDAAAASAAAPESPFAPRIVRPRSGSAVGSGAAQACAGAAPACAHPAPPILGFVDSPRTQRRGDGPGSAAAPARLSLASASPPPAGCGCDDEVGMLSPAESARTAASPEPRSPSVDLPPASLRALAPAAGGFAAEPWAGGALGRALAEDSPPTSPLPPPPYEPAWLELAAPAVAAAPRKAAAAPPPPAQPRAAAACSAAREAPDGAGGALTVGPGKAADANFASDDWDASGSEADADSGMEGEGGEEPARMPLAGGRVPAQPPTGPAEPDAAQQPSAARAEGGAEARRHVRIGDGIAADENFASANWDDESDDDVA